MTHESLLNAGWLSTLDRLGGAEQLETEARAVGAFRRAREVKCAVDLLRLTLAYCLGSMGLRLTAAWAEASGLAILSNVALLQRLRNMVAWLEVLVARLLSSSNGGPRVAAANGRPIRIVDATVVSKAGRDKSGAGGVWRVHAVFDLPSERFSAFELTDETEGECLDRAAVVPGEIRVADRAYLQPDRIARVLDHGADVVIRAPWNGARWVDAEGNAVNLIDLLKTARGKRKIDRPICINGAANQSIPLRLVAIRKPKEAAEAAIAKVKSTAKRKQQKLQPSTLVAAEWLILITSLSSQSFSADDVADLYRSRWRIEIAFKHLKSGAGLVRPPGEDVAVAKTHILCHLLMILLTEPLLAEQLGDSPRPAAA